MPGFRNTGGGSRASRSRAPERFHGSSQVHPIVRSEFRSTALALLPQSGAAQLAALATASATARLERRHRTGADQVLVSRVGASAYHPTVHANDG